MPDKIEKFIASLDEKSKKKLKLRLQKLKQKPFAKSQDIKKLKGLGDCYRLRIGRIRIIFMVVRNEVVITDIDFRGNIY